MSIDDLAAHAAERVRRQFPRIYTFRPETFHDVPAGTVVGGSVWSKLRIARWIVNPAVHLGGGVTTIDLARSWIEMHARLPVRRKHADRPVEHAPLPLLARAGVYDNVAYVDIRSTYRTILQTCGFDVEYRAMNWLSRGSATTGLDDLPKIAYSAIVALSLRYEKTATVTTRDGRLTHRAFKNKYANVALYALVRDILHAVYSDVVECVPVLYANTDGYIVRAEEIERVGRVLEEWGFGWSIKRRGRCRVAGTGSYTFSDAPPRRFATRQANTPVADAAFRAWLRERWSSLVAAREAERGDEQ